MIIKFNKKKPILPKNENFYIAKNATLIGNVNIYEKVSIWFGAVLRGDNDEILIQRGTNIQDNSVLHTDLGFPLKVGSNCTIGHMSLLHGCIIGDNTLIGMGSIIMNGAEIGKNCLIGAGSLVTEGKKIKDNSLVMGRPAKIIRDLSKHEIKGIENSSITYQKKIVEYKK